MTSCGICNVSKHREINNGEKYFILNISSKLDCMYKREVTSSESKYYMGIPGKGLTNSLDLRTKISNNKQWAIFSITGIAYQYFRKLLKNFNNSPYIGYKSKKVHNEPTKVYFFLIKNITHLIKRYKHVPICNNFVKSGDNETIHTHQ